jgi:hypothetical protein
VCSPHLFKDAVIMPIYCVTGRITVCQVENEQSCIRSPKSVVCELCSAVISDMFSTIYI